MKQIDYCVINEPVDIISIIEVTSSFEEGIGTAVCEYGEVRTVANSKEEFLKIAFELIMDMIARVTCCYFITELNPLGGNTLEYCKAKMYEQEMEVALDEANEAFYYVYGHHTPRDKEEVSTWSRFVYRAAHGYDVLYAVTEHLYV